MSTPSNPPKPTKLASPMPVWVILLVFLAGISLGAIVFAAVWMVAFQPQPKTQGLPPAVKISDLLPDTKPGEPTFPVVTSTDRESAQQGLDGGYQDQQNVNDFVWDKNEAVLKVRWSKIEKADPDQVFKFVDAATGTGRVESFTNYLMGIDQMASLVDYPLYRRGSIVGGDHDGWSLYFWERHFDGMCMGGCIVIVPVIVSPDGMQARVLTDYTGENNAWPGEYGLLDWDKQLTLAPKMALAHERTVFQEQYTLTNGKKIIKKQNQNGENRADCGLDGCAGVESDLTIGKTKFFSFGSGCLQTYNEFGEPVSYETVILPRSVTENAGGEIDGSSIKWEKGYEGTAKLYRPFYVGGCFRPDCNDVLSEGTVGDQTNLVKVGTTQAGDPIYAPKDPANHVEVKIAYETWVNYSENGEKGDINAFIDAYKVPVFFWRDALGRWNRYVFADGVIMGECGKPVIYLYPEKTTAVSVKLPGFINVTVSEPTYPSLGWKTVAQPDGTLTMADGKTYGSLYWEGLGVGYEVPKQGFLVKDGEQEKFLSEILPKFGLNATESKEFMDFWLPEMTGSPYYRVSFLTDVWSKAAPLNVNPKPDTSIRIFMDWQKLSAPKTITPPTIVTPERKGFTLVEWGGLLYR